MPDDVTTWRLVFVFGSNRREIFKIAGVQFRKMTAVLTVFTNFVGKIRLLLAIQTKAVSIVISAFSGQISCLCMIHALTYSSFSVCYL